ncbi:DUF2752 domain-containing protein [Streptomyces sp. NPDC002073]|uniref:DUF2752 domain-containing protein n=1 Tax=Streptomyces sp. NBC_00239 TaxID=2903640 RepID=UPI002E2E12DC|nr:DUF2752 domain-containing protein [Streptomyces sp. NBC_00239]
MDATPTPPGPAAGAAPAPQGPPAPAAPAPPAGAPRSARVRRLGAPLLSLAAVAAAFAYVATVDPNEPGHYPVCPLLRLTGILCPGCGGLRSAHAFAHGDLPAALGANALGVAAYFLFAGFTALWLVRAWQGGSKPVPALKPAYWWAVGALVGVFTVVRNLPFGSALAP